MMRARSVLAAAAALLFAAALIGARAQQPVGEAQLIAVLQSDAPAQEKAVACQQLAGIGTERSVPALAALLPDEALSSHARVALEAIPAPAAAQALREALGRLTGRLLVGAVNSVGVRRDRQATSALARLAGGPDREVGAAALVALGRIGTPEAIRVVQGALASGAQPLRDAAAHALLAHAGDREAVGRRQEALAALRRLRASQAPRHIRIAALQRSLVIESPASMPALMGHLRSTDPDLVSMALRALREMGGEPVTRALAAQAVQARPDVQPALVQVLRERSGPGALGGIEALAARGAPDARRAALHALGDVGGPSSVALLLSTAQGAAGDEQATASASLSRLRAPGVDEAILAALTAAPPAAKPPLLGVLTRRPASDAAAEAALRLASAPEPAVSRAALEALATHGRAGDLPAIVRLLIATTDESARDAASQAAQAVVWRVEDIGARGQPIIAGLSETRLPAAKGALLALLAEIGTYPALLAATAALTDAEAATRSAAVRALAAWPDPSPVAALLATAGRDTEPAVRVAALRGAIRLAGTAAAEIAPPPGQAVQWLRQAAQAVGDDATSKRVLLSALAGVRNIEGLALVRPYLTDEAVRAEAELAAIQIARQVPATERAMARSVVEGILAAPASDETRRLAEEALRDLPGPSAELRITPPAAEEIDPDRLTFRPLFDGRTFEGWEGDTERSFRIQDGAIVGGNLQTAIPRNEFLCTTRPYANFVLRLEVRTVNANGGIQIRSRRIPRSSQITGYQADMDSAGHFFGSLFDESRRGMLAQADRQVIAQIVRRDDWNAYEIRCEGPRIRLFVNGRLTADFTEADPAIPLSGFIGLQVHGGPPSETWYRNIQIAELP
ncbi:MAG TPA: DUF1080 domain-containing protein [Chthonomonadales bacterium]|nr:DUF1080 domain-containing protein [Chthonomonadales bacterium]